MNKIMLFISLLLGLSGCAMNGKQVKTQMLNELTGIIQQADCETTCAMLKTYVTSQMGAK